MAAPPTAALVAYAGLRPDLAMAGALGSFAFALLAKSPQKRDKPSMVDILFGAGHVLSSGVTASYVSPMLFAVVTPWVPGNPDAAQYLAAFVVGVAAPRVLRILSNRAAKGVSGE